MSRFWNSRVAIVAQWTFEKLLWSPRTMVMAGVTLFPVALAVIFRIAAAVGLQVSFTGFGFFSVVTATVSFPFVAPMLALFYSSGIVSDEAENGTLPYLITRPITRGSLLAGKMVGSFALQVAIFLPSLVLCFYVAVAPSGLQEVGARFPTLALDAGVAILGIAAYSGIFAFLGAALRRPVLAGLIFVFGWQAAATYIPGFVRKLTVAHYLQSLLPHETLQGALSGLWGDRPSALSAVSVLLAISLTTHALAVFAFSRKEFAGRVSS